MNTTIDLITVIIPLYNGEKYISETLESVLAQTYKNVEIIIVDDGSTDNSRTICKEYILKHNNIELLVQSNSGVGVARNSGLNKASGKFVLFLDSDDILIEDALNSLYQCQKKSNAEFIIGLYDSIDDNGNMNPKREYKFPAELDNNLDYLLMDRDKMLNFTANFENYPNSNYIMGFCWGRLYKISILRDKKLQFSENAWFADDSIFTLDYVSIVENMAILKKPILLYREYSETVSISTRVTEGEPILRDAKLFFDAAIDFMVKNGVCTVEEARVRTSWKIVGNLIIKMIKSTKNLNSDNKKTILKEIDTIIKSPFTQELLKVYRPQKGNSYLLPLSMKLKLSRFVLWLCSRRAKRRYSK